MKTRESGMPEETVWATFFDAEVALDRLSIYNGIGDIVEFGCGYGTFTLPAARRSAGIVYTFDIEPDLVALTSSRARASGLSNVRASVRDFVAEGTGLADSSAAFAMLFNILHAEKPSVLLAEAWRVLSPGGLVGIMHWNYDPTTPRGPSMDIRPTPEQCRDWAVAAGFELCGEVVSLPPYHFGVNLRKNL